MNENALIVTAAVLLSVAFNWLPKLREWYGAQPDNTQRLVMLGALVMAALALFGAGCSGFQIPGVTYSVACTADGAKELGQLFINAVTVNQIAFLILPKPQSV